MWKQMVMYINPCLNNTLRGNLRKEYFLKAFLELEYLYG